MGRFLAAAACAAALALACACNKADEAKARREASDLGHKINRAVNSVGPAQTGATESADEKLRRGGQDLRRAGEKAEVKLDRAALIAKVKAKLVTDVGLSTATSINVDVRGQVVTLKGTVSSAERKRQAEESARQLEGVAKVVNDLAVRP